MQVGHRDANDNTLPAGISYDKHQSSLPQRPAAWHHGDSTDAAPLSPQPMITLTDTSDTGGQRGAGRDEILFSEDWDVILDYLQHTASPMINLSPSWLCRGAGPDIFAPPTTHTPVNHPPAVSHPVPTVNYPTAVSHLTQAPGSHPLAVNHPRAPVNHPASVSHPLTAVSHPTAPVSNPLPAVSHPTATVNHPTAASHPPSVVNHPTPVVSHATPAVSHPSAAPPTIPARHQQTSPAGVYVLQPQQQQQSMSLSQFDPALHNAASLAQRGGVVAGQSAAGWDQLITSGE